MTPEEQRAAVQALTFQPSAEAIELAGDISKLLQSYEQTVGSKPMVNGKQVSDFTLTSHKLMVQYSLQAQNDMVTFMTNVGAFLFQRLMEVADAQVEPEPVVVVAIPPEISEDILQQLGDFREFGNELADEAIPVIRKAFAEDATDEMRKAALVILSETEDAAREMVKTTHELSFLVDEATYEEADEFPPEISEEALLGNADLDGDEDEVEEEYEELV
tara:strand:+ start:398 stop:1051 length:654 start_codon:yes stop_codon:yes gene_type:complete